MENKNKAGGSPVVIVAGLVVIIVITLGVLGLIAIRQAPTDKTSTGNGANTAAVADTAATPTSATASVTDTAAAVVTNTTSTVATNTVAVAVTNTATTAVTGTTAVTNTATAVTTTAAVSSTAAPVTTTAPVSPAAAAPAAAAPVDMAAVKAVVTKGTCGVCHTIPGLDIAVGVIGPNLSAIGADAATRIPGTTAEAYIRQSIQDPNAFIAPKCPTGPCVPGVMLPNLKDILTPAEIDTVVNYLLTLKGQ